MLHTGRDHLGIDRTAVCCLSSVNAEKFLEWREEPRFIEDIMRFLDNVLEDFIRRAPPEMKAAVYSAKRERSVGLGLMGFHSFLQSQGVAFESAMAKSWNMRLFKHLRREADKASRLLAEEKGQPCTPP
jgi:ribonucleoside-diphosphate reductase alpha chain